MSIFSNIFGGGEKSKASSNKNTNIKWILLNALEQLETIKEQSKTESIFIFKHSTRCGISSMVIKQFEKLFTEEHQRLKVYYLDLLSYRNVSDKVGYTFQVQHQSPQLLIIKNGVCVYHASHYDITQTELSRFL
jgi:bacillithiol system protein YtxJ